MNPVADRGRVTKGIWIALTAGLLGMAGLTLSLSSEALAKKMESQNIFQLLGELGGTTGQILSNTQTLKKQVEQVQTQLGQLKQQEVILQKQVQTGQNLQQELVRQEELTQTGVSLMEEILVREKVTAHVTGQVRGQVLTLTEEVMKNASTLEQLVGVLGATNDQTQKLNGQLDILLAELRKSQDSFRFTGRLKDLKLPVLGDTLPGLPNLPGGGLLPGGTGSGNSGSGTGQDSDNGKNGSGNSLLTDDLLPLKPLSDSLLGP
ncbi:hypothetical protein [Effusibacillus lacus]|uniref:Uncharacterized protein n=1 Tax=Effusibacillus lacus TaxID=1348429 RepID=A0A292YDL2_9BACL|nr:hypothetical protein [Effusibacillus lacus]TCS68161.1 hypothetical protein EDD64_14513 [Effusibacillus lacus]GAX90292.1 hypothetical protein EFBL_1918 [Effusibacillus lacus]